MPALLKILVPIKNNVLSNVPLVANTPTAVDEVRVDEYGSIRWELTARRLDGERGRWTVDAVHNGTIASDATGGTWEVTGGAITSPAVNAITIAVALSGSGDSQVMRLVVTSLENGWYVDVSRGYHIGSPV